MRVTIFLLFFCVFSTIAGTVNSQNARVSIHKTNVPLEEILNEIEHQTDYLFMYSNNIDVERTYFYPRFGETGLGSFKEVAWK